MIPKQGENVFAARTLPSPFFAFLVFLALLIGYQLSPPG